MFCIYGGVLGGLRGFGHLHRARQRGSGYLWCDYAPHEIYGNEQVLRWKRFVCSALGVWMVGFRGCVYIGGASTPEPLNP